MGLKQAHCPSCGKKLAEHVEGLAVFTCPRCNEVVTIDRRIHEPIK